MGLVRPRGILELGLPTEFVGDTEGLAGPEPSDALGPVRVLVLARGTPVPREEFANTAGDHTEIVAPWSRGLMNRGQVIR